MDTRYNINGNNIYELAIEHKLRYNSSNADEFGGKELLNINKKGFGRIVAREDYVKGISMLEWKAQFENTTRLYENMADLKYFSIYFNLGSCINSIVGKDELFIDSSSHNVWSFANGSKGFAEYQKNKPIHTFSILLEESFLMSIFERYPNLLSELHSLYNKQRVVRWKANDAPVENEMLHIIYQLKKANLMGSSAPMYVEGKIHELLSLQLNCDKTCCEKCDEKCGIFCKTPNDIEKMHEAKAILLNDIYNPPTTYELSRQVGINEKKLKNGFKEVFDQTIYNCLFEHKMTKARQLLLDTNKQITDVAYECGYDYPSHFATAFKRNFGLAPNEFRKRKVG